MPAQPIDEGAADERRSEGSKGFDAGADTSILGSTLQRPRFNDDSARIWKLANHQVGASCKDDVRKGPGGDASRSHTGYCSA